MGRCIIEDIELSGSLLGHTSTTWIAHPIVDGVPDTNRILFLSEKDTENLDSIIVTLVEGDHYYKPELGSVIYATLYSGDTVIKTVESIQCPHEGLPKPLDYVYGT